ncbi:MAG: RHS repeat-associated core domain-containing protein, partial [Ignavibacteria bacterium]
TYDKDGNILTLDRYGSNENLLDDFNYVYYSGTNKLQRVIGAGNQFGYDYNGNMIQDYLNNNSEMLYDNRNLLTELKHRSQILGDTLFLTKYFYDEAGNRIRKMTYKYLGSIQDEPPVESDVSNTNLWILKNDEVYSRGVDGKEFAIYKNGTFDEWIVWGNDMVGKMDEEHLYFYQKDHLGSIRAILNENQEVVSSQDYDPWGYILEGRTYQSDESKFKFTGKERDEESFYDYFGSRYYDSRIANWTSVDPLLEKHYDFSPYNYVLRNPLIFYDPNGKQVFLGGESFQESKGLGQYIDVKETQQTSDLRFDLKRSRESGITTTDVGLLDPVEWISGGAVTLSMRLSASVGMSVTEKLVEQSLKNISKSGITETSEKLIEKSVKDVNIEVVGKTMIDFLGEGTRKVTNKAGDVLFVSKDNLRKVRFDINKFNPHDFKHIDIETKIGILKTKTEDWLNIGKIKIKD